MDKVYVALAHAKDSHLRRNRSEAERLLMRALTESEKQWGKGSPAEEIAQRILRDGEEMFGRGPSLAKIMVHVAQFRHRCGRRDEAVATMQQATPLLYEATNIDRNNTELTALLADWLEELGTWAVEAEHYHKAIFCLEQSYQERNKLISLPDGRDKLVNNLRRQAWLQTKVGNYVAALDRLRQALSWDADWVVSGIQN